METPEVIVEPTDGLERFCPHCKGDISATAHRIKLELIIATLTDMLMNGSETLLPEQVQQMGISIKDCQEALEILPDD